jgi:hypothetical protein
VLLASTGLSCLVGPRVGPRPVVLPLAAGVDRSGVSGMCSLVGLTVQSCKTCFAIVIQNHKTLDFEPETTQNRHQKPVTPTPDNKNWHKKPRNLIN